MRANFRRLLLAFGAGVVLCGIAFGGMGVLTQPIMIDENGRRIDALQLTQLTAIDGVPVSKDLLRTGPKGFTLDEERDWWQARKRLASTLRSAESVTLSQGSDAFTARVTQPSASRLKGDLGIVLGATLLFAFGCVVIAERYASTAGLMLALYLLPGSFVLLATGVFELVQISLPYWSHRALFALTAFGNVGLAAGVQFALIFPRPHRRWQIEKRRLWMLHVAVFAHCLAVASGVFAHATLVPVAILLALGMTVLMLQQAFDEKNKALRLHLSLLACPLPIACVVLFLFYAFALDLGLPRIDGSSLSLIFIVGLVLYAALFENAALQQQRAAEQRNLREELHDDVLSRLANISLMSEVALQSQSDREELATRLASIQDEAQINAWYARDLLRVSSDCSWDEFCAQLRETGSRLTRDHDIAFNLVSLEKETQRSPSAPMRICIYKMLREAIHNTIKHARASAIDVEVSLQDDALHFRYRDDGAGFDERTLRGGHFGLEMLRRRAQELGAALRIESSSESGTTLAFSGPIA